MKIQKTVTEEVIDANRRNAQRSTGPRNVAAVRGNALKHGFLAKHLTFDGPEDEQDFRSLHEEVEAEYQPTSATERMLVEKIAVGFWKLRIANGWETQELANRRNAARAIVQAVTDNCDEETIPLFTQDDGAQSAAQFGWDCKELTIRSGSTHSDRASGEDILDGPETTAKMAHLQVEAKLGSATEFLSRYVAAVERDFYKAIQTLREIKREMLAASSVKEDMHGKSAKVTDVPGK